MTNRREGERQRQGGGGGGGRSFFPRATSHGSRQQRQERYLSEIGHNGGRGGGLLKGREREGGMQRSELIIGDKGDVRCRGPVRVTL